MIRCLFLERIYEKVLFDMDGTLVDSRAVVERTWRNWAERHGLDAEAILAVSHGRRTEETVRRFAPARLDVELETENLVASEVADVRGIRAVSGAQELISSLSPRNWAVVTSASRALATRRMTAAGLPLPALMIAAEDVSSGKPDPEGYLLAAARLGAAAKDCLVFEDAPAGVEAARRAGCDVVAITAARPHSFEAGCPEVESFADVAFRLARGDEAAA